MRSVVYSNRSEDIVTDKARIELSGGADLKKALPDISNFPLVVTPQPGLDAPEVEIFVIEEQRPVKPAELEKQFTFDHKTGSGRNQTGLYKQSLIGILPRSA